MIMEKSNEFAGHTLSNAGMTVAKELSDILNNSQNPLEAGLKFSLAQSMADYPPALLNQVGLLHEMPKFKTNGKLASQFSYELSMIKTVLANEKKVKEILGADSQAIADLVFAILVSDIGKAGPIEMKDGQPGLVVHRIYTQAIFTSRHEQWLMNADPANFPEEIKALVNKLSEEDYKNVFEKGAFFSLPLDVYLYVIKQVALDLAKEMNDPELEEEAEKLFTLSKGEREFLFSIGASPTDMPMRALFTNSHIRFGRIFLSRDGLLTDEQKKVVPLALSHHFSQGVLPKGMTPEMFLNDESLLRNVAFLEILDKFDAFYCRYKDAGPEMARDSTWKLISRSLSFNYSKNPEILVAYREMFEQMVKMEII